MRTSISKEFLRAFWKPIGFLAALVFLFIVSPASSMFMAFGVTTSDRSAIPAEVNNFYDRVLLTRAIPLNIHGIVGQLRRIPSKAGTNVIKFRRYGILAAATTPLTEGTTPAGSTLSVTDITSTVYQYGDFVQVSDVVDEQSPDPVLTETVELQGDQLGLTNDVLTRDILTAGTTVQYVASATSRGTVALGMNITLNEVKRAVRTLKNAKARKVTAISNVSPGMGTVPINAAYVGIVAPGTSFDLKSIAGFKSVETYSVNTTIMPGEIGSLDEVRFIETTNAKVFSGLGAGGIDVYGTLIFGANAYGIIDLGNSPSTQTVFKPLGSAGSADPLNQRQTMGWKEFFTAKILNDTFMIRVEHAVTA